MPVLKKLTPIERLCSYGIIEDYLNRNYIDCDGKNVSAESVYRGYVKECILKDPDYYYLTATAFGIACKNNGLTTKRTNKGYVYTNLTHR